MSRPVPFVLRNLQQVGDMEDCKMAVERGVVDADQREWHTQIILSPAYPPSEAVWVSVLEGSPPRGIVIQTPYVTFACTADGRRIKTVRNA